MSDRELERSQAKNAIQASFAQQKQTTLSNAKAAALRAELAAAEQRGREAGKAEERARARGLSGPEAYKLNLAYERMARELALVRSACRTLLDARYRDGECDAVALSRFERALEEAASGEHDK